MMLGDICRTSKANLTLLVHGIVPCICILKFQIFLLQILLLSIKCETEIIVLAVVLSFELEY